jgi:pre-mRNA-splicing factor 38B
MSRAALWRQESNLKERERQANETFENAVEEGRNRPLKGLIPLKEDTTTFNLNPMLLGNISKSGYFLKACNEVKEWTTLVDEIYYHVKHMEPWQGEWIELIESNWAPRNLMEFAWMCRHMQ